MEAAGSQAPIAVDRAPARSPRILRLSSDEGLVQRVRSGSEAAFAALYERHYRKVLSFCRHMLGSHEEAEDAVQQAFANAYRDMLRDGKELNFRPWLYRIARNQCLSILRARRASVELEESEPSALGLSRQVTEREELRELLRDLARLPDDQREALLLAELHDNSHSEVAEIIGCDTVKVKSLVFQARSSLISSRQARETPCEEIRAQLSVLRGGSLRRNTIRRHLKQCDGCRSYKRSLEHQRRALAALLPVIPSTALKFGAANAIAAVGVASKGSAAGGALSGPLATLAGKLGVSAFAVKGTATVAAVTVVAGGGAVAVKQARDGDRAARPAPLEQSAPARQSAREAPPGLAPSPIVGPRRAWDRGAKGRHRRSVERRRRGGIPAAPGRGRRFEERTKRHASRPAKRAGKPDRPVSRKVKRKPKARPRIRPSRPRPKRILQPSTPLAPAIVPEGTTGPESPQRRTPGP